MWQKILAFLVEKVGGRMATKLVTVLATLLVSRGLMSETESSAWIETTVGILLGLVSIWMTSWSHKKQAVVQEQAVEVALNTPCPDVGIADANGQDRSHTNIGKNKYNQKP